MAKEIKKVAVLGAGIMGSGIAAHFANAGIECFLLDIDGPLAAKLGIISEPTEEERAQGITEDSAEFRSKLAFDGLQSALKARPAAFFDKAFASRITPGNYEDNSEWLAEADWIIEVVAERLDIKEKVFANVEKHRRKGCIVSSNTSGLMLQDLVKGRSDDFKKCFLITHFFNPVRYMRLLEVITGADTDPGVLETVVDVCSNKLGKGIVYAKDTPNFIANRIGIHGMMTLLNNMKPQGLTIDFVDKILAKPLGRPMGVFRVTDLVGLDTVVHVAKNTYEYCPDDEERDKLVVPDWVQQMVDKKMLGNKTKGGFYKVEKKEGGREILTLDVNTLEYRPKQKVSFESLGAAKGIDDTSERIRYLCEDADDQAAEFTWEALSSTMVYAANRIPEIADDIVNIDNAMKWGYNWELGPFETWDAIGVEEVIDRLEEDDRPVPELARQVMEKGGGKFYGFKDGRRTYFDVKSQKHEFVVQAEGVMFIKDIKARTPEVKSNPSATLLDLGDGVFGVEFHTKMNAIDDGIIEMLSEGLDYAERDGKALVVANDGEHFSAGANIFLIAMLAQQKAFDKIEEVVGLFQKANIRFKYAKVPVVSAPFNYTFGGGAEIVLASSGVCAHAELYIGLVEVGVGLIPGGGGNSQFLVRAKQLVESKQINPGPMPTVQKAFETIGFAKVATSAQQAVNFGFLRPTDKYIMDRSRVLGEAKKMALELAEGYQPPEVPTFNLPGTHGRLALEYGIDGFVRNGVISEHDKKIGYKLARVLTGGDVHPTDTVTEQQLLDLEREAFVSLTGEQKTLDRIQHMLMKGKPLRN